MIEAENRVAGELARMRQHRACSATVLLKLAREKNLESPEVWGWNELALVPQWSFLEADELLHTQRVAGSIFLSPQLIRCIDGRVLSAVSASIGSSRLQKLLDDAELISKRDSEEDRTLWLSAPDSGSAGHSPFVFPGAEAGEIESLVDALLCRTGSAVLMSTVAASLPMEIFEAMLGPVAGTVTEAVGLKVIAQAMKLIAEVAPDAAVGDSEKASVTDRQEQPVFEMT